MKSKSYLIALLMLCFFIACGGSDSADADSGQCVETNCHGPEVTCGFGEPIICTAVYQLGEFCRSYVSCVAQDGTCTAKADPKYKQCTDCVKACESKEATEAFECEGACRTALKSK